MQATREPDFQQERARRSYLALIEAATDLFAQRGYDATGTPEIAQRAGVSVGTFYRYFDDKHEIYVEVVRRTMADAYTATIDRLGPERFVGRARHETISEAVAVLFDHVLARPQLQRSFAEMALRDPEVAALQRAFDVLSIRRLTALIAAIAPRAVVPDPEATAYVLYACAMQTTLGLESPPVAVDRERAHAALTSVIERAVFGGG